MSEISRATFTVKPEGVGRPDYSMNVEMSVEPQIRSWQEEYQHYQEIEVAEGARETREIEITARTVVLIYDFYLSAPRNLLLRMNLEFYTAAGTWAPLIDDSGYQTVEIHYKKGFRFFRKYRVTIRNYGDENVLCSFSAHGLVTPENIYYGEIVS